MGGHHACYTDSLSDRGILLHVRKFSTKSSLALPTFLYYFFKHLLLSSAYARFGSIQKLPSFSSFEAASISKLVPHFGKVFISPK